MLNISRCFKGYSIDIFTFLKDEYCFGVDKKQDRASIMCYISGRIVPL